MSYVAVVGSRCLPSIWSCRVDTVVASLLSRGRFVGSGGAVGADLFALCSLVRRGCSACSGSVVFLPGEPGSAPSSCVSWLSRFVGLGGRVVAGPAPARASRRDFVSALFARSRSLVSGSAGVVAFVSGPSSGTWFTVSCAVEAGLPVVVWPVAGPSGLRSLGAGRWVPVRSWSGAFRWASGSYEPTARREPGFPMFPRCIHGLVPWMCSFCSCRAVVAEGAI